MNDFSSTRKGQYFSFDAIIASVIFVLTIIMLLSYWHSVRTYLDFQANDLSKEATRIANLLFTPPTGDCSNLDRFGLVNSYTDKRVNESLVKDCYVDMDQAELIQALGASHNVSIVITDLQDTGKEYILGGVDPADDDFTKDKIEIAKFTRIGTLDTGTEDHMVTAEVYVYR